MEFSASEIMAIMEAVSEDIDFWREKEKVARQHFLDSREKEKTDIEDAKYARHRAEELEIIYEKLEDMMIIEIE